MIEGLRSLRRRMSGYGCTLQDPLLSQVSVPFDVICPPLEAVLPVSALGHSQRNLLEGNVLEGTREKRLGELQRRLGFLVS